MHPFDGRVVSNFIRQALAGEDITIFGEGQQTRSFCYRDDLIEGMMRMMNAPDDFRGPVNLGNPERIHHRAIGRAGDRADRLEIETRVSAAAGRRPALRRPGHHLGTPAAQVGADVTLRDGLKKTIAWFRTIDLTTIAPRRPIIEDGAGGWGKRLWSVPTLHDHFVVPGEGRDAGRHHANTGHSDEHSNTRIAIAPWGWMRSGCFERALHKPKRIARTNAPGNLEPVYCFPCRHVGKHEGSHRRSRGRYCHQQLTIALTPQIRKLKLEIRSNL